MFNKFTLYPAIDIKNGKCVRLLFGDMEKETVYNIDPLDQAMWFVDQGAEWLHIVDLDGAVKGEQVNTTSILKILKTLQNKVKIQIGGGIRSIQKAESMLNMGVSRVIVGTALFQGNFLQDLKMNFDADQVVLALDFKINNLIPTIYTHGW